MALKRIPRRRRASITSLIDVIFLLLLFFMLASTFSKFSEMDIAVAGTAGSDSTLSDILELEIGRHHMMLDGDVLPSHGWHEAVEARRTDTTILALRVSEETSTQRLADVLAELSRIPDLDVYVMDVP